MLSAGGCTFKKSGGNMVRRVTFALTGPLSECGTTVMACATMATIL